MAKPFIPIALKTAVTPLLTRKLFYGAAVACAVGLGLGAWLEPPKFYYGTANTVVTPPAEQPNPWLQDVSVSPISPDQAVTGPNLDQTAAVSPPAAAEPMQVADKTIASHQAFDRAQVDASGDTSQAQPEPSPPSRMVWTQTSPRSDAREEQDRGQARDWASYNSRPGYRDNEDYLDSAPPPRAASPPDRPPWMQGRRWQDGPDGSAAPWGDQDDGG